MNRDDVVNNIPMRIVGFHTESVGKTRYEQMDGVMKLGRLYSYERLDLLWIPLNELSLGNNEC